MLLFPFSSTSAFYDASKIYNRKFSAHIYLPTVAVYLVWLRPGLNHPPLPTIVQMNCQIIGSWEWHRREHVCCRLCIGCSVVHCCNFTSSFWGQQRGKAGESDTIHVKQTNYTVIELDKDGWLGHTNIGGKKGHSSLFGFAHLTKP